MLHKGCYCEKSNFSDQNTLRTISNGQQQHGFMANQFTLAITSYFWIVPYEIYAVPPTFASTIIDPSMMVERASTQSNVMMNSVDIGLCGEAC